MSIDRSRRAIPLLVFCLSFTAPLAAQLQPGDVIACGLTTAAHLRSGVATPITAPTATSLSTVASANRVMEHLPGTQLAVLATSQPPPAAIVGFTIYLLDFSTSLSNPTSTVLTNGSGRQVRDLDVDLITGDVYVLFGNGDLMKLTAPIGPGSSLQAYATGQTSGVAVAALPGGNVLVSSAASTWYATTGATAAGPNLLPSAPGSRTGLAVDPTTGDILLATSPSTSSGSLDRWAFDGTFLGNVLQAPDISGAADAKFDPSVGLVYCVATGGAQISGSPYGVQTNNDNVVVANAITGPSAALIPISPPTGYNVSTTPVRLALYRTPLSSYPLAQATPFGVGCMGSAANTPVLVGIGVPRLGGTGFALGVGAAIPFSAVEVLLSAGPGQPTPIGGGCIVWVDLPSTLAFLSLGINPLFVGATDSNGAVTFPTPIPPNPALGGLSASFQALNLDGGAPLGFTLTNALTLVIGA